MSALGRFARFYNTNFERRPVATLIVTNGVLNTIADVLTTERNPPSYDAERTLRFAIYGMAMGPLIGRWLRILERTIPMKAGGSQTVQLAKRVLADQAIMAPLGLTLFVGSMGVMEGKTMDEIGDKFKDMYWPALLANWKVWPLIQTVNFKLMPLPYRLPFQSTCGIAWTLYLSLLNAKDDAMFEEEHTKYA